MTTTDAPTREDLVGRAAELVPLLRRHAPWAEEHRRLHEEVVEALTAADMFKLRRPRQYGGLEVDTRTLVDVATELGRGDGSAAWVTSVTWIPGWMACMFPDHVQDEVFAGPDTRVCGTLSPSAMAFPAEGGVVVNGKWQFISGAHHADWQVVIAIYVPAEGEPYPVIGLVPMSDLLIVDDWNTFGLKGTGSVSTVAKDLFVPQDRILPLPVVLAGQSTSKVNAESPIYRSPLLPVASASSVGAIVGLGRAAQDAFLHRLPGRKISYTGYDSQREAPVTHLQVADAVLRLDEAEFHAHRLTALVDGKGAGGGEWTLTERVQARADMGAVVQRAKEAVDIFAGASGGSSIYTDLPIQRVMRDIHAVHLHALMHPNTNAELYGRVLCGLEPNTLYI
ncbi:acyl-CoA dehydrogenase family protein [Dactylosporangium sp. NPDC049140]|uniref:acyl-CoA dehydrogenase family protein n=1 Tax=Dactylosporangium sp. NPDC049140 TaxID=3155647 RepID=UPI0033CD57AB